MADLEQRVEAVMQKSSMLEGADRILVGVSGGADSVCLLRILKELSKRAEPHYEVRAAHYHHGLREAADQDAAFVQALCRAWGIPLSVTRLDVRGYAAGHGCGTEEAGHILRQEALEREAAAWESENPGGMVLIALAHHVEDQAETVLFRLARGTGIRGAGGMALRAGRVIRPLLPFRRDEIETWLLGRKISWRTDETNADAAYSRNRIRQYVLPQLVRVNPQAPEHLAAFAAEEAQTEAYLRRQTVLALERCRLLDLSGQAAGPAALPAAEAGETAGPVGISTSLLAREDPLIRRRILYLLLAQACGRRKDLTAAHVDALAALAGKKGNGRIDLPHGMMAVRSYDRLVLCSKAGEPSGAEVDGCPVSETAYTRRILRYEGNPAAIPRNDCTKWFDYDKIALPVVFRTRKTGDRMTLGADGTRKALTRCMIDAKIPAGWRDRMVLPFSGDEVLWLPGGRISARYPVDSGTRHVLELRLKGRGGAGETVGMEREEQDEGNDFGADPGREG